MKIRIRVSLFACCVCIPLAAAAEPRSVEKPLHKFLPIEDKSNVSLMPERQLARLSPDEIRDLVSYLASPRQVSLP